MIMNFPKTEIAGVFMITTKQKNKFVGYSMDLHRKVEQIKRKYCEDNRFIKNKLVVNILFDCHRCFKGICQTEVYLENLTKKLAEKNKATILNKKISLHFEKISFVEHQPIRYKPTATAKKVKPYEPKTKKVYAKRKTL